jgi:hypothetical protein
MNQSLSLSPVIHAPPYKLSRKIGQPKRVATKVTNDHMQNSWIG